MIGLCLQVLLCKSKLTSFSLDLTQNLALVALVRLSGVYLGPPKSLFAPNRSFIQNETKLFCHSRQKQIPANVYSN